MTQDRPSYLPAPFRHSVVYLLEDRVEAAGDAVGADEQGRGVDASGLRQVRLNDACPVIDQDGKTVECKGGDKLDPGQILSMNFYVKGIDDKIPGK